MSKNLTRKGLVLGAVVALGSSLIAGAPAQALPTALYLDTSFGTSGATQQGVLGAYFSLSGTANGAADNEAIKYQIEGLAAADLVGTARFTTDATTSNVSRAWTALSAGTTLINTDAAAKIATVVPTWSASKIYQLALKPGSGITATTTIKVTPFVDSIDGNNKPSTNELVGPSVSITFNKQSELTATPTFKALTLGAVVSATVAVDKNVNVAQFRPATAGGQGDSPFTVEWKRSGQAWGTEGTANWDSTDKEFVASTTGSEYAEVSKTYGATAQIGGTDSKAASSAATTNGDVLTIGAVGIANGTSFRATTSGNATTANVVRSGTGSITAEATITADAGKSIAGQTVTFTVTETSTTSSIDSGASITAGGKTLKNSDSTATEKIEVTAVTNADGKASLAIAYTGLKDADTFQVTAKGTGATGAITTSGAKTVVAQDSRVQAIVDAAMAGQATPVRKFAKGSAITIPYTIVDQFGQVPTGTYQVVFSGGSSINYTATVPVGADGKVSFSGTDVNTASTNYTITATLQKKDDAGTFQAITPNAVSVGSVIYVGTVSTPKTVSITPTGATTAVSRQRSTALVGGHNGLDQQSVKRTKTDGLYLSSTILDTEGANAVGVAVTYSAPGVLFGAGDAFGFGSLTVYTNASGSTGNVYVYSNLTGKQTITVSSGSAKETQLVTFAEVTAAAEAGATWTITAPTYILPGQTLKVTGVLKDKFGAVINTNPTETGDSGTSSVKQISVTYTGPGYVTKDIATETDADGVVSFTVLLGASDTGVANIKFVFAGKNKDIDETTLNDDVVGTAVVTLGAAPAASATAAVSGSSKKFYVSVSNNAAAKNVVVKVAGKTVATLKGSAAKKTYTVKATKGSKKVTVYVGGKLVATKTVTVK